MLNLSNIEYINPALKFTIKEYFPIDTKILLYDILLFLSLKSKTPMTCSSKDLQAFKLLLLESTNQEFDTTTYISHAYDYILKYCKPGHRLPLSYLLNEHVIEYCAKRSMLSCNNLIHSHIINEILTTEKEARRICSENSVEYKEAIEFLMREDSLPDSFIAFKYYNNSDVCDILPDISQYKKLLDVLEPIFIFYTARNGLFQMKSLVEWNNSKIEEWKFCPIMFRDRYLIKLIPEMFLKNEATDSGTAVHKICELIIDKYNKNKDIAKAYNSVVKTKAYAALCDVLKEDEKEHLEGIKTFFFAKFTELVTDTSQIYSEQLLKLPYDSAISFYGTPDLFIINDSTCYLLDFKTSKLTEKYLDKNNSKYHDQLSLYSYMIKHNYPVVKTVTPIIVYTRGLVVDLKEPISNIVESRAEQITFIKTQIKNNMFRANSSSCFLCRHPDCSFRTTPSIWAEDGTRVVNKIKSKQ